MSSPRHAMWWLAGLALLSSAGSAWACGHCLEDRIASVYDHALVERSQRQGRKIMYLRWDGPVVRDAALSRAMAAAAAGVAANGIRPSASRSSALASRISRAITWMANA